jgi:hypothetical protein
MSDSSAYKDYILENLDVHLREKLERRLINKRYEYLRAIIKEAYINKEDMKIPQYVMIYIYPDVTSYSLFSLLISLQKEDIAAILKVLSYLSFTVLVAPSEMSNDVFVGMIYNSVHKDKDLGELLWKIVGHRMYGKDLASFRGPLAEVHQQNERSAGVLGDQINIEKERWDRAQTILCTMCHGTCVLWPSAEDEQSEEARHKTLMEYTEIVYKLVRMETESPQVPPTIPIRAIPEEYGPIRRARSPYNPAPRAERAERIERIERIERTERAERAERAEKKETTTRFGRIPM